MSIKKTTLHPENDSSVDLYPKTSADQIPDLNDSIKNQVSNNNNYFNVYQTFNGGARFTKTVEFYSYVFDEEDFQFLKWFTNKAGAVYELNVPVVGVGGNIAYKNITQYPVMDSVPIRTIRGTVQTSTATESDDCVNLNQLTLKINEVNSKIEQDSKLYLHKLSLSLSVSTVSNFTLFVDIISKKSTGYNKTDFPYYRFLNNVYYIQTPFPPSKMIVAIYEVIASEPDSKIVFKYFEVVNNSIQSFIFDLNNDAHTVTDVVTEI